jgi:hypothetical protein
MPVTVEVEVRVDPALTAPAPFLPYLKSGMERAVELVRVAGERNVSGSPVRPSGKPRRVNKPGYGPLKGSLTTHVATKGPSDGAAGFVRTGVFYARFLEYGAKPHAIIAKMRGGRQRMLAFGDAAEPTFRLKVKHPGIRGRHWMRSAAEGETPAIVKTFEDATRTWADAVFGTARAA